MITDPAPRRIRAEDCQCVKICKLRPAIQPHQEAHTLDDGTHLELRWLLINGAFASGGKRGTAFTPRAICPGCNSVVSLLRRPPESCGWGCCHCLPLIHASQRRSGNRSGHKKPTTYRLDGIAREQLKIADLLQLQQWPPANTLWNIEQLHPQRRLSMQRKEALLDRLEALESERVALLLKRCPHGSLTDSPLVLASWLAAIKRVLQSTRWALRENWSKHKN